MYDFTSFEIQPSVTLLQLHVENNHLIGQDRKSDDLERVTDREYAQKIMLTVLLQMNSKKWQRKYINYTDHSLNILGRMQKLKIGLQEKEVL